MKFKIMSDGITYQAEKSPKEYEDHLIKKGTGEDTSSWEKIEDWDKHYPIV